MNLDLLIKLLQCHSTPGDEDEVVECLTDYWEENQWSVTHHGPYAMSACYGDRIGGKPTVLVCAHMDSPGYIIDAIDGQRKSIVKLGGPGFNGELQEAIVKIKHGKFPVNVKVSLDENNLHERYYFDSDIDVEHGDRLCFIADPTITDNGFVTSPFLDNRIGCFALCQLSGNDIFKNEMPINLVLGATSYEEIGSRGAMVLAQAVKPDFVVCLDATYENKAQDVNIGKGPVLTISDASVILSCRIRDQIVDLFEKQNVPLQTEVYNFSGTDAKAFPLVGLECHVLALLIASTGNHSPEEIASISDIKTLVQGIEILIDNYKLFI